MTTALSGVRPATNLLARFAPILDEFANPIGFEAGDTNLRRYVGNAPTLRIDPTGLREELKLSIQIVDATKNGLDKKFRAEAIELARKIYSQADVTLEFGEIERLDPAKVRQALGGDFNVEYAEVDPRPKVPHSRLPGECEALWRLTKRTKPIVIVVVDDITSEGKRTVLGRVFQEAAFPGKGMILVALGRPSDEVGHATAHELYHYITDTDDHRDGALIGPGKYVQGKIVYDNTITPQMQDKLRQGVQKLRAK